MYYQSTSFLSCYPEIVEESFYTAVNYAIEKYPEETCGVVIRKRDLVTRRLSKVEVLFHRCSNKAEDKERDFKIDPHVALGYRKSGALVAFYHNHTDRSECIYTTKDLRVQKANNLPSFILRVNRVKFISITVIGGGLWRTRGRK